MRWLQLLLVLLLGLFAVWLEFRNIKRNAVLGIDMLDAVPLIGLCLLTSWFIITSAFKFKRTKSYYSFLPGLAGIIFIMVIFGHKKNRSSLDNSPTLFEARNYDIGSDGGLILDFKKNSHLDDTVRFEVYWR